MPDHDSAAPAGPTAGCDQAHLARLLPLWPHELADTSLAGRRRRVALLRRALRAERQRGIAGHWTYDLGRHWALLRCYRAEVAALAAAEAPCPARAAPG